MSHPPSSSRGPAPRLRFTGNVTAIASSIPGLPSKQVIRENILSTLDDMFHSGIELLTVEVLRKLGKPRYLRNSREDTLLRQ